MRKNTVENSYLEEKKDKKIYLNGQLFSGDRISFYDTGELEIVSEYLNGERNGWMTKYNKNGSIYWKVEYQNDLKHGRKIVYADEQETEVSFLGEYKKGLLKQRDYLVTVSKDEMDLIEKEVEDFGMVNEHIEYLRECILNKSIVKIQVEGMTEIFKNFESVISGFNEIKEIFKSEEQQNRTYKLKTRLGVVESKLDKMNIYFEKLMRHI